MDIRADLRLPALLTPEDWQWVDSPQPGVTRVMLDRVGDEVAVATSFVRYAEGSYFPRHEHALGEEFIVLEGEFGDEAGRYPVGTYIRNPPGSAHTPFSDPGCLIWVKLRQFDTADLRQLSVRLDLAAAPGVLHEHGPERVWQLAGAAGDTLSLPPVDEVQEVLVLEGAVRLEAQTLPTWSWLRLPAGAGAVFECEGDTRLFAKTRPA